jgi:hypothetical protein
MDLPILLNGIVIWAFRKKNKKLLTSIDIKFFRTAGHTLFDHTWNEEIL